MGDIWGLPWDQSVQKGLVILYCLLSSLVVLDFRMPPVHHGLSGGCAYGGHKLYATSLIKLGLPSSELDYGVILRRAKELYRRLDFRCRESVLFQHREAPLTIYWK